MHWTMLSLQICMAPVQGAGKPSDTVRPMGLPWDWHLEPVVFSKTLQYSHSVSLLPGGAKTEDEKLV